ncbi:hypothetical protein LTR94_026477, partial [Friedmanniomyces endolithicus]
EGGDLVHVLDAGRGLHARGHIDQRGAGPAHRVAHIARVQAAGERPGQGMAEAVEHRPVESHPHPAGQFRAVRRLGIVQDQVGRAGDARGIVQIGTRLHRDDRPYLAPTARADRGDQRGL